MNNTRAPLLAALLFLIPTFAQPREVWLVRFGTLFPDVPRCQPFFAWQSQALFHNSTDADLQVNLLGVSNSDRQSDAKPLVIPAHRSISLRADESTAVGWSPSPRGVLWVVHLDVPDGVLVANRIETVFEEPTGSVPPCLPDTKRFYGGLPFPVFKELVPARKPQYHLGADVGGPVGQSVASGQLGRAAALGEREESDVPVVNDARMNLGVYNGGSALATASVEIRCGVNDGSSGPVEAVVTETQLTVPPNTLVQTTVLGSSAAAGCSPVLFEEGPPHYYAIVTVDQPSFSYVAGLSNEILPRFPAALPFTY